jgi:diadenosine tetraphosphate (Ap4A) HIT family hydrolase
MNHTGDAGLQGWFILSPVRHVTAARHLTSEERGELAEVASAADEVLTTEFGSRRTLIASLGWYASDHLHIRLASTFRPHVSYGSLNFDGAYIP